MLRMERIASAWERVRQGPDEDDAQALYALFEGKLLSILPRFAEPKPHVLDTVAELAPRACHRRHHRLHPTR